MLSKISSFYSGIAVFVLMVVASWLSGMNKVQDDKGAFGTLLDLIRQGNLWAIIALTCILYLLFIVLFQTYLWIKAKSQGNSNY